MTEGSTEAPAALAGRETAKRANRWTLWLVLAVCVAPFAGSLALYHFSPPDSRMNYGELTEPRPLPGLPMSRADGAPFSVAELRGKWIMLQADGGACEAACRDKLYKMRQVRLAQGKNMDRVRRLWIVLGEGAVDPALQKGFAGTIMVRAGDRMLLRQLPSRTDPTEHIWLLDPLGNVMLRYPPQADPTGMKNDLVRLLKVSKIQ